jgi:uroporphyrinogen decarboxylase
MTRRERILTAIARRETDLVPVGFKATDDVLDRLKTHLGVRDLIELVNALPVDTYGAFNNCQYGIHVDYVGGPKRVLYPDSYPDGSWDTIYGYKRHWVSGAAGRTDEAIHPPLANATDVAEVEKYEWPRVDWFDYRSIERQCEAIGDHAIVFNVGGLGQIANLIGFERMLTDMMADPPFVEACFERLTQFYVEFLDRVLAAGQGIDIICIQDDFGTQQGPLLSLEVYRKFYKPCHQRIFQVAHRHSVKAMMHSCGAVFGFIPEFIEIGADILDPLQTNAVGMDPVRLKKEFGKDLCFHGGIDTQHLLVNGSPTDVCRQVDELIRDFGKGGGYILAPSHYIQADAPFENVLALFEHVARLRR